ncbi:hypothetical protein LCGC14_2732500, partial [marine sediment metagenome]
VEVWDYPDGSSGQLPPIGLDTLFKFAVPKLDFWLASKEKTQRVGVQVQYLGKQSGLIFGETLALALF